MRIHREIVLGAALVVAFAFGFGCAREESSQGASAPTTYTPYSTTKAPSNAYGNAGTGYSTPASPTSMPSTAPTNGTGSMDNVPSGVGGGPMDDGTNPPPSAQPDPGTTNDDGTDKRLDPNADDHGKSDIPQPLDKSKPKKN
jgi:hypothetical protein